MHARIDQNGKRSKIRFVGTNEDMNVFLLFRVNSGDRTSIYGIWERLMDVILWNTLFELTTMLIKLTPSPIVY